ncbi:MAG: DUF5010 domain-containing protein [Thermoanaerobaculia bacterium]
MAEFVVIFGLALPCGGAPVGYTLGYAIQETNSVCQISPNLNLIQTPLFKPYNRDSMGWWYDQVEEAAFSNISYIALNFRGDSPCGLVPPNGNEPTSFASNLVTALNTRGYGPILKVTLEDDTGAYPGHLQLCTGRTVFDFSDHTLWQAYVWDTKWKPFFERVPDANRMKVQGRPLVIIWSVVSGLGFSNQNGNLAPLISWLRGKCQTTFGFDPFIVVDISWIQLDPSAGALVDGVNKWFYVASNNNGPPWSKYTHNGYSGTFTTGVANGGFFSSSVSPPAYLYTPRDGGATLRSALVNMASSDLVFIEGLTDSEENAGVYRGGSASYPSCNDPMNQPPAGQQWSHPNQYLNIVREYTAPFAKYVIYEAEAADTFATQNTAGSGLFRRDDPLNIVYTDSTQSQWAVALRAGEALEFKDFQLGASSTYRMGIRYASTGGAKARLKVDGVEKAVIPLVTTGGTSIYTVFTLGQNFSITAGVHNIRLELTNGSARVDQWILNGFAPPANPTVVSVSPTSAAGGGGATLSLAGQNYVSGTTVKVGGVSATGVTVVSGTLVRVTSPARPAGTLNDVRVTNPGGLSWTLPKGYLADFADVQSNHQFHLYVERLFRDGVTAGCGAGIFCPDGTITNAQMAVWLLKAKHGYLYSPPPATGSVFADVPANSFAAAWIEELSTEGISGGCGGGLFCPNAAVLRGRMAALLLRAKHGGGYLPPPATGMFLDVPLSDPNAPWIEELVVEGIAAGCGGGNYCPSSPNTRGQMSVFLGKTFDLQ